MTSGLRGRLRAALLVAVMLFLAGCSSIPTVGPVGTATPSAGGSNIANQLSYTPPGPADGAGPQEIIEGFITAGVGAGEDYSAAREFLTAELASSWVPGERVVIYGADPNVVPLPEPNAFQIQLEVVASVNAGGIRTNSAPGTTETIQVRLAQQDGEWRISGIPNGVMISDVTFPTVFQAHNLYFYSSTYSYWVPDTRWFIRRSGIAASVVNAMLAGPAPYLQGAVTSAFPAETSLARDAVPVVSGVASVDFSAEVLEDSSDLSRQQMALQLEKNLRQLNNVNSVEMTVNQRPVDLGPENDSLLAVQDDPRVGDTQIAVSGDSLTFFQDRQAVPIENLPDLSEYGPREPAVSADLATIAFLSSDAGTLLVTGPGKDVAPVASGSGLSAPSVDPEGWIWSASDEPSGSKVIAVGPDLKPSGQPGLTPSWLEGMKVKELRISRDGARALLVVEQNGTARVLIAGVVRSSGGTPQTLTAPLEVWTDDPVTTAVWVGETSVAALQKGQDERLTPVILDPTEENRTLAPWDGGFSLSGGDGPEDLFLQTADAIYKKLGNGWIKEIDGLRDPAFPG
ncbi:LpqB family beta-propeller domain-containing protein [Arthrobacter caoxuetaonis]|uniref:LpqB family beta-propeller domain-containing protein n=1 Tax=Arthrobacter caoxuetaonis TaxID=2886935 RepID=A0A9X1MCK7_9MICC|nr:LpqB family beta-propeller domain-containing protein [Arthrobacter caoxuetaonis]MCC3280988.1 LpqB family beta-propeller domain-containing protein [Arthrobacter caoxuetaonis]MCC3296760.1 LpqB family beta-propeller domain-containing protein [Arthrobacter caoxuetaonis]USQ56421.1 LpqB family beta-propeller domain-containing protein [Arthrobacter caoxuetaonis]